MDRQDVWRIYWCVGLIITTFVRIFFGDPAHASASTRSTAFVAVWVIAFLTYASILYFQGQVKPDIDYFVLIGLIVVIALEVAWPLDSAPNFNAGNISVLVAGISLGAIWREHRRNRKHVPSGSGSRNRVV